jgi:hypothetical protein
MSRTAARIILFVMVAVMAYLACAAAFGAPPMIATVHVIGPSGTVVQAAGCRLLALPTVGPVRTAVAPTITIDADCRLDAIFKDGLEY